MNRKFKAVVISEQGNITNMMKGTPLNCPVRGGSCNSRCAWFSHDNRVVRCKDSIIGITKGKTVRSFQLSIPPAVYNEAEDI